ncbi:MAG: hypothetical protein N2C14_18220, partial [Planctomycetales bacterium]
MTSLACLRAVLSVDASWKSRSRESKTFQRRRAIRGVLKKESVFFAKWTPQFRRLGPLYSYMDEIAEIAAEQSSAVRDSRSDGELVRGVRGGRREEYEVLVRRYLPMIEAFLAGKGLRGPDVDEAAQNAFVAVYRRLDALRNPDSFAGYLLKTAARCVPKRTRPTVSLAEVEEPS